MELIGNQCFFIFMENVGKFVSTDPETILFRWKSLADTLIAKL